MNNRNQSDPVALFISISRDLAALSHHRYIVHLPMNGFLAVLEHRAASPVGYNK